MYFSIPNSIEIPVQKYSTKHFYRVYQIYVNGVHHCSLRYSQLLTLHQELQRLFPMLIKMAQIFPPKKLFDLSAEDIDERRILLERYLQSIVQRKEFVSCSCFNEFFLRAQCETCQMERLISTSSEKILFNVSLLNEEQIHLENIPANLNGDQLFELCINKFHIDNTYRSFFGLFYYEKNLNQLNIIRPVFSFEAPYLTLKKLIHTYDNACLILKKSSWNRDDDSILMENPSTCKLLFIQAVYDLEQMRSHSLVTIDDHVEKLTRENSPKEYIQMVRQAKFYGFILLPSCAISYLTDEECSDESLQCLLAIGNYEIICYFTDKRADICFKVTRIRCWKVVLTDEEHCLMFEYLLKKDTLTWIRLHTKHAPLVSTCLQSMVDEILSRSNHSNPPASVLPSINGQHSALLPRRTEADLNRLSNNALFDQGETDDDL